MASKPDAVFIGSSGTPGALPQLELVQRGYPGLTYQTQGIANNDFLRIGGKSLEGTFVTVAPVLVAEQLADSDPIKKPALTYVSRFETQYGPGSRSLFGSTAWDVYAMLSRAAEVALRSTKPGTPEFREALRNALEGLRQFVAAEGVYSFSDKDHNGVDERCQVLVRIDNGKWKLVP
jgi:branched-chain amino acid transport system substrate-binding protein